MEEAQANPAVAKLYKSLETDESIKTDPAADNADAAQNGVTLKQFKAGMHAATGGAAGPAVTGGDTYTVMKDGTKKKMESGAAKAKSGMMHAEKDVKQAGSATKDHMKTMGDGMKSHMRDAGERVKSDSAAMKNKAGAEMSKADSKMSGAMDRMKSKASMGANADTSANASGAKAQTGASADVDATANMDSADE